MSDKLKSYLGVSLTELTTCTGAAQWQIDAIRQNSTLDRLEP